MPVSLGKEWWRGGAIYQIYPRSFLDSNGDGVGDLAGIISKLDYVASLGVDGVWLSPFFTSPMADFGYDVADYKNVDPVFGTLKDFDALVARAHELSLKVVIDQVYCHTSDRHAWFSESRTDRQHEKADWYVWADAQPDGSPPNNWLSLFGGPAWTWDTRRRQYYLHHFLKEQPTLNLHNKAVIDALIDVGKFWVDRGVDGFRLDALNVGMHDQRLRNNLPADDIANAATPYAMQDHVHTLSQPGMESVVAKIAKAFRRAGGDDFFTVAEIVGADPHAVMKKYTAGSDQLSTAYSFDFIGASAASADLIKRALSMWPNEIDRGYPSWALSNHDCRRVASRWRIGDNGNASARLFALLYAALRGTIFIYQGEELGLPQADIPPDRLVDPEGLAYGSASQGRDGARTPIPWASRQPFAGFSTAEPWLPVDPAHGVLAVDAQDGDDQSVLSFFRRVLAVRQSSQALRRGDLTILEAPENILAVRRTLGDEDWICVYNISAVEASWTPQPAPTYDVVLSANFENDLTSPPTVLPPLAGYAACNQSAMRS